MTNGGNQIGVIAVFDLSNFSGNVDTYISELGNASTATEGVASSATTAGAATGGTLAAGMTGAVAAAMALIAVVGKIVQVLGDAVKAIAEFSKESLILAARTQELSVTAQLLGQRMGYSNTEIQSYIEGMKEYGIRSDVAAGTISQMARYNLDLSKSIDLARTAQDSAVLVNKDSSAALERLTYGIVTHEKRVLRMAGSVVDLEGAYQRFAKANDKTTQDLSEQERIQIALNEVIKEGARVQGVYEAALETPGKKLRTLRREFQELQITLGTPFLGTMGNVVDAGRSLVDIFSALVSEGGALYPVIVWLAAALELLSDALDNGIAFAQAYGKKFFDALVRWWEKTGQSAAQWGANIIKQLALGIIAATRTFLLWAIKLVSRVLTFWFKASSPPRILPDIEIWGRHTMEAWLKGFTEADFSALKDIQQPLRQVLDLLADAGRLAAAKVGKIWADLSEQLIEDFSKGNIAADTLKNIANATGRLGSQLVKLIKDEFALARAINEVEKAQLALNKALKAEESAEATVKKLTREYNNMLRAGASPAVLKNKLKEINAAEDGLLTARKERTESEIALDIAKEITEVLEQQVKLQKELIDQMLQLAQARVESAQAAAEEAAGGAEGGAGGAGGAGLDEEDLGLEGLGGGAPFEGLETALNEAIAEAKAKIKQAIKDFFAEIIQSIRDSYTAIKEAFFGSLAKPLEELGDLLSDPSLPMWYKLGQIGVIAIALLIEGFDAAMIALEDWFQTVALPWLGTIWDTFVAFLKNEWKLSVPIFEDTIKFWKQFLKDIQESIGQFILDTAGDFLAWATGIYDSAVEWFGKTVDDIGDLIDDIVDSFTTWFDDTLANALEWGSDFKDAAVTAVTDTVKQIGEDIAELATDIGDAFDDAIAKAEEFLDDFLELGKSLVGSIIAGIVESAQSLYDTVAGLIGDAIAWALKAAGIGSPSKYFVEIGKSFATGLEKGMLDNADLAFSATSDVVSTAVAGAIAAATVPRQMSTVTNNTNIPMNVNIHNGMNAAQLRAIVRDAVSRELR